VLLLLALVLLVLVLLVLVLLVLVLLVLVLLVLMVLVHASADVLRVHAAVPPRVPGPRATATDAPGEGHSSAAERCTEDRHVAISPAMLRSSNEQPPMRQDQQWLCPRHACAQCNYGQQVEQQKHSAVRASSFK